jgi:hypothetical protein
MSREFEMIMRG